MIFETHQLPEINSNQDTRVTVYPSLEHVKSDRVRAQFKWMRENGEYVTQVGKTIYRIRA